jgi:heme exporter protein A
MRLALKIFFGNLGPFVTLLLCLDRLNFNHQKLSFSVRAGESLCIGGENGAGKTTLLRTIVGLKGGAESAVMWHTSFCFVGHADWQTLVLTVKETLSFWATYYKSGYEKAIEVFDLSSLLHKQIHQLSQGQKQRLALARLLCGAFRVWVIDEPFAHLDASFTEKLSALFKEHLERGGAILFSDHKKEKRSFPYAFEWLQDLSPSWYKKL